MRYFVQLCTYSIPNVSNNVTPTEIHKFSQGLGAFILVGRPDNLRKEDAEGDCA